VFPQGPTHRHDQSIKKPPFFSFEFVPHLQPPDLQVFIAIWDIHLNSDQTEITKPDFPGNHTTKENMIQGVSFL
jgi:hypothetical protein